MSNYDNLANEIIKNVGGKNNVLSLEHCVTRLRFKLKDESKANDEKIKNLNGVVTLMKSAGQYQIVIGNHVADVYDVVISKLNLNAMSTESTKTKISIKDKFIDLVTAIFMPGLSMLCACGMIKGLNTILNFAGIYSDKSGIYTLIAAIGDSMFYFFPIVIGYTSAKKFKMSPFLGMILGAVLCYPTINGVDLKIFGIAMNVTYTTTVLPIIITVALGSILEKTLNKIIPKVVKSFLVPMIVLLVCGILGFMIIGPVSNLISNGISKAMLSVYSISPIIACSLFGGLWQILIVFGVHMAFFVLAIVNISNGVPDPLLAAMVFVCFAQCGVLLAMMIKTKDKKLKEICIPSFISGIFGVTEPAIYGITLPRIKMFIISCIGGAISGAFVGITGLKYHNFAGLGLFEIPALFPANGNISTILIYSAIAVALAFFSSFIIAFIVYKDDTPQQSTQIVYTPISGTVKALSEVDDAAFSSGALGQGAAIVPDDGKVYAPFDGTVEMLFPTKHAIGLVSDEGCELVIHIGMNTVQLEGKYFEALVQQGDKVKKGQPLIQFDIPKIKEEGYSLDTPVLIINTDDYSDIEVVNKNKVLLKAVYGGK